MIMLRRPRRRVRETTTSGDGDGDARVGVRVGDAQSTTKARGDVCGKHEGLFLSQRLRVSGISHTRGCLVTSHKS